MPRAAPPTSRVRLLPSALFARVADVFYGASLRRSIAARLAAASGLRVLDVACGTGALATLTVPCSYYGVDVSLARLQRARRNAASCLTVADASALPFPSRSFDRLLVCGLFHHVDDALALRIQAELARVTAADGYVVVLEAIWPRRFWNVTGAVVRLLDEGRFVRRASRYLQLWSRHFEVGAVEYPTRLSLECLLTTLRPRA
jgi:ubiquinone/menaquinone biosynthesis C-methylase UbiE